MALDVAGHAAEETAGALQLRRDALQVDLALQRVLEGCGELVGGLRGGGRVRELLVVHQVRELRRGAHVRVRLLAGDQHPHEADGGALLVAQRERLDEPHEHVDVDR